MQPELLQHTATQAGRGGPRTSGAAAEHDALHHRPAPRHARPLLPRQAPFPVRRGAATHRGVGDVLRHGRRAAVRADGRVYRELVQRDLNSRDKLRCLQILSRHEIGIPDTTFVRDRADVLPAIGRVGGAPVDHQAAGRDAGGRRDSGGDGEDRRSDHRNTGQHAAERPRAEVRRREQGTRHPGVRRRRSGRGGDAAHRPAGGVSQQRASRRPRGAGGTRRPVPRRPPCARRRSWACESPGSTYSEADDGPRLIEVNSSPGLEGIEGASKLDIAGAVIDYMAAQFDSRRWTFANG